MRGAGTARHPQRPPRFRQGGKFGIGGGDDDHISGSLPQIDSLGPVRNLARLREQEMHLTHTAMETEMARHVIARASEPASRSTVHRNFS